MTWTQSARGARKHPPLAGSIGYLLLSLPVGILGFVLVVTTAVVGVSTAIVWVGVPFAALAVLLARGTAQLERARIYALLDTYVPQPYRRLPTIGPKIRWRVRLSDSATWRDVAYVLSLLPLGIVEFVLVVTFWSASLGFVTLPVFYRLLPGGAYFFPAYDLRWITVDSVAAALPWTLVGLLLGALAVVVTRGLARAHARFAGFLLGPTRRRIRETDVDGDVEVSTCERPRGRCQDEARPGGEGARHGA